MARKMTGTKAAVAAGADEARARRRAKKELAITAKYEVGLAALDANSSPPQLLVSVTITYNFTVPNLISAKSKLIVRTGPSKSWMPTPEGIASVSSRTLKSMLYEGVQNVGRV